MTSPSGGVSSAERLVGTADRWECVHFAPRSQRPDFVGLSQRGFFVAQIAGQELQSRKGLFSAVAREFRFPGYFGENWDALADCLGDLEWLDADRFVLIVDGARDLSEPLGRLIEVWLSAAQEWSADAKPFHLVVLADWNGAGSLDA